MIDNKLINIHGKMYDSLRNIIICGKKCETRKRKEILLEMRRMDTIDLEHVFHTQ